MSLLKKTTREINASLRTRNGKNVYLDVPGASQGYRVFRAKTVKGDLKVLFQDGWYTVQDDDKIDER